MGTILVMQTSDNNLSKARDRVSVDVPAPKDQPLVDLRRVAYILWHRRLVIIASFVAAILCAVAYIALTPSTYTARTVLLVDPREMRVTDADEVLSGIGSDSAAIASQVAVLRSRELLTTVLQQENIFTDPEFVPKGEVNKNAIYDKFLKRLSVDRQGLTYVIEVAFTSRDREKSARISNAIVARYIQGQLSEKSRANADVTGLLVGQIDGLRKSVADAEAAAATFMAKNGMLDLGEGRTLLQSQIEQLNLQVLASRDRARRALNRFDQAKSLQPVANALITDGDILSSPNADLLRNAYNQNSVQLSRLANIFGPHHPQYIAQVSQLNHLKTLMDAETKRIIRRLDGELKLANEDLAKAQVELNTLRSRSEKAEQAEIELRQLQLQASSNREVLQQFMLRSKETSQLDNLQRSEVRVISKAVPPTRATWPRPSLLLAIAGFIGAAVGLALALLLGAPTNVIKTASTDRIGPLNQRIRSTFSRKSIPVAPTVIASLGSLTSNLIVSRTVNGTYERQALTAAKLELTSSPSSAFSVQLWTMIGKLCEMLPQRSGPHLITFSGKAGDIEACRVSYNTAAGLERLGASVLLLDLHPLAQQPPHHLQSELSRALSDQMRFRPELLLDHSTGLSVINANDEARGLDLNADAVDRLLAKAAGIFDFIVVNALPWQEKAQMQAILERSDHLIVVLTKAEDNKNQLSTLASQIDPGAVVSYTVMETVIPKNAGKQAETPFSSIAKFATRMAGAKG